MSRILVLLLTISAPAAGGAQTSGPPSAAPARLEERADAVAEAAQAAALTAEAEAFMAGYADALRAGDRAGLAARYDRRGAFRLGHGEKTFERWEAIRAFYAGPQWQPPARFEWRALSYEPAGANAVVVAGLFLWGTAGGVPRTYSYTALLVRQDGELRIRLEDESGQPQR